MSCDRVLADFAGKWRLSRRILPDHGPEAEFEGTAEWVWSDDRLLYRENGLLKLQGLTPMQAERRYVWGADLSVFFDDGRFFHQIPRDGGEALHWCDPDTYVVRYDFDPWPMFQVHWDVRGPKKAYKMQSTYVRG
ncbi:MAG: DUF6314 family protein [Sulfitobacter sp.]